MSSIIITVVAIVLVAILAIAGMFYGGTAMLGKRNDATAAQVINQSSQIVGAVELFKTNNAGTSPATAQALVDGGYLRDMPNTSWHFSDDAIVRTDLTDKECAAINKRLTGDPEIKACPSGVPGTAICCTK